MRLVALLVALVALCAVGCGSASLCQAIAAEYAAALPAAKACDVPASNSCGAARLMELGGRSLPAALPHEDDGDESERLEVRVNGGYWAVCGKDQVLVDAFEKHQAAHPEMYAPL